MALISACLDVGVNTGKEIVGMVGALGFDRKHVGTMLTKETGSVVGHHRWRKATYGVYCALTSKVA